ncbi:hypothetical protein P153DRAFT_138686 [Dothidotthia symphoricarpi CBS 119687]|uniref:Uncharacterized protein n=1 Tax=Dothidotthia symphoricarpi CBS 119687 TaxID=1392245 RepID=A0A6A5ZX03_9PLEO|nr:uncharacterized protein P153DRAFT_138686 [Dothidotthia symphoricarpi CBS 119687]KAF2124292.1 hypothetical protein P153DRAFT_138686 [Dothidotthia symphoricarpi CBS 119687]
MCTLSLLIRCASDMALLWKQYDINLESPDSEAYLSFSACWARYISDRPVVSFSHLVVALHALLFFSQFTYFQSQSRYAFFKSSTPISRVLRIDA